MSSFKSLGRSCPICQGERRDCRESLSTGLIHCRSVEANPGGQWRYIKDDTHGFGMWAWGEGEDKRDHRPIPSTTPPAVAPVPSLAARDAAYRALVSRGLSRAHRVQLLRRPQVTEGELEALTPCLFSWQGGDAAPMAAQGVAGVSQGKLLYPKLSSWAIAIPNSHGQLLGVQIKNPEGGYVWASSTKVNGPSPHLPNGEIPMGVWGTAIDGVANLAEGYFKPALAQARYGGAWIGMAGGNWAQAPQQLREGLEALGITAAVLTADGGAIANPNVMGAYRKLATLLDSWGIPLSIRWWGQKTKDDGDVDEIERATYQASRLISWSEFEAMAPSATQAKHQRAQDTKALRRQQTIDRAKAILNQALPTAHRETSGGYLPELPPLPGGMAGYCIDASMGAGKTTAIGRDIVASTKAVGGFTIELSPRNSLGEQTAEKHGLIHIHEYGTDRDSNQALGAVARDGGGMVLCPHSLPRAAQHFPSAPVMVIDEAMATLTEALQGETLKGRYAGTVGLLFDQMRSALHLHISESNLDQPTLDLVERVSGKKLMVIRHQGNQAPWPVHLAVGGSPSGMFAQMVSQLKKGDRLWLTATSLDELAAWDIWAKEAGMNSLLITGETNEAGRFTDFFKDPDTYLEQHQIQFLLTNQSVQTGLSVERYPFDAIYGYGPGFAPETLYQQLGRYRQPCPRYVWVPAFIQPSRWEKPQKSSALAEMGRELGKWAAKGFVPTNQDSDQAAIDHYLAARWESAWAQKVIPGYALTLMLERAGHTVTPWELEPDLATKVMRDTYREKLARHRSEFLAGLTIDPDIHTPQWAKAKRDDSEATYRDRCIIRKLTTLEKFPGIDWNNSEIWYQGWFRPRQYKEGEPIRGPIGPGAALWTECDALDYLQSKAAEEAALVMAQRLRSIHLLPDYGAKLAALAPLRPLCEQLLAKGKVSPGCPLVRRLAGMARAVGDDLYRYLRIVATNNQSDSAIANKILRKFGLIVERSTYRRSGKARLWEYTIAAPPLWQSLIEARAQALNALQAQVPGVVTNLLEIPFNKSVTTLPVNIPLDTWVELTRWVKTAIHDGQETITALKDLVIKGFGLPVWTALAACG